MTIFQIWVVRLLVALTVLGSVPARGQTITYFHNDASGSPVLATTTTGSVLWKEDYRPFGEKLTRQAASASNRVGYHGKPFDDGTGLSYMQARYYDPVLARFMAVDPAPFDPDNLHSFNRYTFANNNPYKFVDPNGEVPIVIAPLIAVLARVAAARAATYAMANGARIAVAAGEISAGEAIGGASIVGGAAVTVAAAQRAKTVAVEARAASVGAEEASVVANGIRGRAAEARTLNELGLTKNTTTVSTAEGRSIPDALTNSLSVEVKDAASVSLTKQMRIQTEAAKASGRKSVLVTGTNTCVSGPCQKAVDQIVRKDNLGPN